MKNLALSNLFLPPVGHRPLPITEKIHHPLFTLHLILILAVLLFAPFFLTPGQAASSPNVTFDNDLYRDMEFWAAEGLVTSNMSSIRPMARSEVGRQLAEAMEKCNAAAEPSATCRDIQTRYAELFEAEIAEAQSADNVVHTYIKPLEKVSVIYNYQSGAFSMYNNEDIYYGRGHNAVALLQSQARAGKFLSFFVQPTFIFNQHHGIGNDGTRNEVRLHKGYAKLTFANIELEVGRDSLWWGPGYHGSLLMSNNARPFDIIKLSNPEPVRLPWIFSYLGHWQFNLIFSQLNDDRQGKELANPFLYGFRLGYKPVKYLELGASHLVVFGGPGRRDLSFKEINQIIFGNIDRGGEKTDSNQQVSVDFALTLPNLKKYIFVADGIKLYGEIGAEDHGHPPTTRAWLAGLAVHKPFGLERAVIHAEYATTILGPYNSPHGWYVHPSYPMQFDGRVFGHHAGCEADDFYIEWSHGFKNFYYKLSFDMERSGIKTKPHTQLKNQYIGELGYRINNNMDVSFKYGFEKINNPGNVQDANEQNHYLGGQISINF